MCHFVRSHGLLAMKPATNTRGYSIPLAKSAFEVGMEELQNALSPGCILDSFLSHTCTGSGEMPLDCPPEKVKQTAVELEEYHPLGRLFDIAAPSPRKPSRPWVVLPTAAFHFIVLMVKKQVTTPKLCPKASKQISKMHE